MEKQKDLLNQLNDKTSLVELQEYIRKVIEIRGFSDKSIQEEMLLLLEETGELAKAIRKKLPNGSVDRSKIKNYTEIEEEIADIFIVLTNICNILQIDLYKTIIDKEKINVERTWESNKKMKLKKSKKHGII